ncbi:Zinc/iron permease [Sodiomyces alkalinus F11]|uniref:Zinc/iron permease n=1 Tax=Sodiomyces alkalinus (strain CBS 110278 / VKM F-3762 / F11) TaxID=1314773 RepID=A0A3N2PYD4_SODAK|nr:Zinc/iron permease [Sodiomyces alkalinus F11]ROT39492.1 Zinc/iron permease [Sodiomyces alkalinus F11]
MDPRAGDISWATIPTNLLLAELARRGERDGGDDDARPECGSGSRGSYDTGLHVGALILILTLSTVSCGIPLLSRGGSGGHLQKKIIFYCQHFGTGVLLATAFVHLLPTAFLSLTDPCLPYFFSKGFKPMAGLVAMIAALTVVALEMYLATRGAGHAHSHHYHFWDEGESEGEHEHKHEHNSHTAAAGYKDTASSANGLGLLSGLSAQRSRHPRPADFELDAMDGATQGLISGASPLPSSEPRFAAPSRVPDGRDGGPSESSNGVDGADDMANGADDDDDHDRDEDSDLELELHELDAVSIKNRHAHAHAHAQRHPHQGQHPSSVPAAAPRVVIITAEEQARLLRQCLMLEGGILFHSIFIGMAISVATGPTFVVFLIAVSFHQTFEGLALGSRIAAIQLPRRSARPWLMALAFGATTPFGQLIGLVVHNMYDPMSQTGLLMVGFMNSISSGLLLFAGLVQLLAEDFLTEKSYSTLAGGRRWRAYMAVVGGAILMAIVGGFA